MEAVRINKYLSEMGICSRREADRLLERGRIQINGKAAVHGQKVQEGDLVVVDGKPVKASEKERPVLLAFHKPRGVVCTTSGNDRAVNIIEYIGYKSRIFPIGRLDKDSEGIILLTNQGELVNRINRQRYGHEKEYVVRLKKRLTEDFLLRMAEGVDIMLPVIDASQREQRSAGGREYVTVRTKPCKVKKLDEYSFDIILTQGLNRQIRRMCDALGNYVDTLKRIRVMNIELGTLPEGACREVEGEELKRLYELLSMEQSEA